MNLSDNAEHCRIGRDKWIPLELLDRIKMRNKIALAVVDARIN